MKRRFATAPPNGRADGTRLAWWLLLVGVLAVLGYASRLESGKPDPQVLYEWSTAIGGLVQDAIVLAFVLAIAGLDRGRLAFRRPRSYAEAAALLGLGIVAIYIFEVAYTALAHPGNEQGLTPSHWEPHHAAAYVANAIVICTWVPFVEELTYRGLGFTLLQPFGEWPAILLVGLLFGLAHGLLISLPIIVVFGCVLAFVRSRTDSVFPGMLLHAAFNFVAIVAAVTISG